MNLNSSLLHENKFKNLFDLVQWLPSTVFVKNVQSHYYPSFEKLPNHNACYGFKLCFNGGEMKVIPSICPL